MRNEESSTPLVVHSSDVWAEYRKLRSIIFRSLALKAWRRLGRGDHSQWRVKMTAFVVAVSRRISSADPEALTPLLLFCGAGLFVSLLAMSYGLDLSYDYGF
jgi:hypothetical protein